MHKDNMSSKAVGNPVKVEVHAAIDRLTKKVTFTDEWEADWANGKQKGDITVPYGTPPTEIQFHLRDDTPLDPKKKPTGRKSKAFLISRARDLETEARELEDEFQARARREGALPGWLRSR